MRTPPRTASSPRSFTTRPPRDAMTSWATSEGLPYPLGVSWCADDRAYNFAMYSKHATAVRLLLFGDDVEAPRAEIVHDDKPKILHVVRGRCPARRVDDLRELVLGNPPRRSVDFPASFDPSRPKIILEGTARLTWSTASTRSNTRVSASVSIASCGVTGAIITVEGCTPRPAARTSPRLHGD
jgi:hypothetical protein